MKYLIVLLMACLCLNSSAQNGPGRAFWIATFGNQNVYKTKGVLTVKKFYSLGSVTTDQRDFALIPNPYPAGIVTQTTIATQISGPIHAVGPTGVAVAALMTTTTTVSTIPASTVIVTVLPGTPSAAITPAANTTVSSSVTNYSVPPGTPGAKFLRYKVVGEEGDYKYIKILPGCYFGGLPSPQDTSILYNAAGAVFADKPENYVFKVDKKQLTLNTHYLASSALIGKLITLPVRFRNKYWDGNNTDVQGTLALGYGFGWRYKLGNNPYHTHYLSTIFYGVGISQQKYFSVGRNVTTGKDTTTAKTDEFAITYLSFGIAYEYDKFNIGIFWGRDKMFGSLRDWAYQDKWWWGIGIGYELFK